MVVAGVAGRYLGGIPQRYVDTAEAGQLMRLAGLVYPHDIPVSQADAKST
jgi:hypothetical protein